MLIAIVGTRWSGRSSLENYLTFQRGFTQLRIRPEGSQASSSPANLEDFPFESSSNFELVTATERSSTQTFPFPTDTDLNGGGSSTLLHTSSSTLGRQDSFLSMTISTDGTPLVSPAISIDLNGVDEVINSSDVTIDASATHEHNEPRTLNFASAALMLDYVTRNWRSHFVTVDLQTRELVETFVKRPFFMLVAVDAPLLQRFERSKSTENMTLETFVREHDFMMYGNGSPTREGSASPLRSLDDLINLRVVNSFQTVLELHAHLNELDLLEPNRLRPEWDTYFMTLASLASRRSNCMKRRVGAILVRNNRILSTGYNGTPRGLVNCNQGGCVHCNEGEARTPSTISRKEPSLECVCLHAEENALLEAGRERVGDGAVLYCNTCPCLKCTVKIIQTGVKEVIYNLSYKVDDASARLFAQAGVELRRHDPRTLQSLV